MGFQSTVNRFPALGVEGDFCSENPRKSMLAGEGALVAGPLGVIIGRFAWADANGQVTNAKPAGDVARLGFAAREGNMAVALITTWMAATGMTVPASREITLHTDCAVLVRVTVAAATIGQKVFVSTTDGTIQPGDAGATVAGFEETDYFINSEAAVGELAMISLEV